VIIQELLQALTEAGVEGPSVESVLSGDISVGPERVSLSPALLGSCREDQGDDELGDPDLGLSLDDTNGPSEGVDLFARKKLFQQ
jgi:hypothetical protein